jgi:two-component system, LytTR family, response regulator
MEPSIIKAVMIDDEAYALESLGRMLGRFPNVHLLGQFSDPEAGLAFVNQSQPDLVFLDIQMPGLSGFDLLDRLQHPHSEIIFVTSFDSYAIKAIRYSALDYLLKPVNPDELRQAIERFDTKRERSAEAVRWNNLRDNLRSGDENSFDLVLQTKHDGEHRFKIPEIVRCEADSNYTRIYLNSGKKFMASKTLGDLETLLSNPAFVRIHKSHLVNRAYVRALDNQHRLLLHDDSTVPVSYRRHREVAAIFGR